MKDIYVTEREGQIDFYNDYIPLVNKDLTIEDILADNNDGVLNGNIIEFKTMINDTNAVLFQVIKYLSARRIKGKAIPKNILLISLNDKKSYVYNSAHYLEYIEKVYTGGASKNNISFSSGNSVKILDFYNNQLHEQEMISLLRENIFIKINIDENCIVGWANKFYKENPEARKADFIGDLTGKVKIVGEIRKPDKFKDYINPYIGDSNVKFNYLMDKLNDNIQKKNLGAFYTPSIYAKKSLELVREAIKRVPIGHDYVIIDRCAGTGNLEIGLTKEELSHCILSTYEYYEYKVLIEILGDKVRHIIPPTEKEDTFDMGLVRGSNALSETYIFSPIIKQYIDNPNVSIILFENPPYSETTSIEHQRRGVAKKNSSWKNSYVVKEMKIDVGGTISNDLGNAFIWSAFKYYLRQATDSYIVYSPVKYWKVHRLVQKKFLNGFAFNRRHFHTNIDACIMVALWSNEDDLTTNEIKLDAFNIYEDNLKYDGELIVKRIFNIYSKQYYDKRIFENDTLDGIAVELTGKETNKNDKQIRVKKIYNENIIAYMVANQSGFDNPDLNSGLTRVGIYAGNGFFLRKDNYLEKLPMFSASRYINYNKSWTQRSMIMKSADGAIDFKKDIKILNDFLLKNLLFISLEMKNHCRSINGSDGRTYRNELCLDNTNGETIATKDLVYLKLNSKEAMLFNQWIKILELAKKTDNYNKELTYGIYQIWDELNTFEIDESTRKKTYHYPELNGHLITIKSLLKEYYLSEIVPNLFKYQFLK